MDENTLRKVALRYKAIFLNTERENLNDNYIPTASLMAFATRLMENGYCLQENLLHALSKVSPNTLTDITTLIQEILGTQLNWAPLVKGWDVPTGENLSDHLVTFVVNSLGCPANVQGEILPCGHMIPEGTFPLERYNGCPFCGTPFRTTNYVFKGQTSKLKELRLFSLSDMEKLFHSLLTSSTPLDATQQDSLKLLLTEFAVPTDTVIPMKETVITVVQHLTSSGDWERASAWMRTPTDVLRYLWYEKTKHLQIIEPRYLIAMYGKANRHVWHMQDQQTQAIQEKRQQLKLKYDRRTCRIVATWLNNLPITIQEAVEDMNPKRGMWIRFIHALRLGEYSRKKGFNQLATLLHVFYQKDYTTWRGKLQQAQRANEATTTLQMLSKRPGLFARSLFSTMLRFGKARTLSAFEQVIDNLPSRLLLSLVNTATIYFDPQETRIAKPITGGMHQIPPHPLLALYSKEELQSMANGITNLYVLTVLRRFSAIPTNSKTIYIDSSLYNIPVSVGDRSSTIQDTSVALQGTHFPVEGDSVRLFLHWGKGLPAQYLDMDLSCRITMSDGTYKDCAYYSLTAPGAKHSGDIQSIPDMVGTAEYIELSLPELQKAGAKYVTFTCNAYSNGTLAPNLFVGWMNSVYPMTVSNTDGVAYDPSCVQHMIRISEGNLSKGLIFGVLKVDSREIIWLEMPFMGQTIGSTKGLDIEALLKRLEKKLTVGQLLSLKREAQQLTLVDSPEEADEAYTYEWAMNAAEVSKLL